MSGVSREAWLRAVGEAEVRFDDPNALTVEQLSELFTCCRTATESRVKKLVKCGLAKLVRVKRQDSSGKWRIYNGYVLTEVANGPAPRAQSGRDRSRSTRRG